MKSKMMKNIYISTCIIIVLLFLHSCQKNREESSKIIEEAIDIVLIENQDKPQSPILEMKFIQDLSITEEAWWPHQVLVDNQNNMLVYSCWKPKKIIKFNKEGKEILRKEFSKGQGPGEFSGIDPSLSKDGRLFIVDSSQRRLTILDKNLEIMEIKKLQFWGGIFSLDSQDNMYFLEMEFLPKTRDRQKLILAKFSPKGIPLQRYHEYEWGQHRDNNGIYHTDAFRTQIRYKIDSNDNVYYATTNKYEINVVSPDGKVIKRITKKSKSRKLTQTEIDEFKPKKPNPRSVIDIPKNVPYVADLFILDNDYLLVVTFESRDEHEFLLGDVFDKKGIYRARVQIPKYYRWNFLLAPSKSRAIYKNGYFYTIKSDKHEENFWVKRYIIKMNI